MFKTVVLTNGVHLRRCPGLNARNDRQGFTVGWRLTIYRFGAEKRNPGASETASDLEGVGLPDAMRLHRLTGRVNTTREGVFLWKGHDIHTHCCLTGQWRNP